MSDNTAGDDLQLRVEILEGMVSRLQAERNRRVELTELGKLSEELEADNWGSAATLVRSAMHELEDLRRRQISTSAQPGKVATDNE